MHKSFFVALTGNAFDVGISYEQVVEVHVFASIAMWILAAVQIRIETRKRQSPALHRLTGVEVMLLLFFLIVFPSSLYLSALQRIEYWAPAVAAVLLDTAGCTAFFLYRGWRVARLRATSESLALHGRLMQSARAADAMWSHDEHGNSAATFLAVLFVHAVQDVPSGELFCLHSRDLGVVLRLWPLL